MSDMGFEQFYGALDVELEIVKARRAAAEKVSDLVGELECLGFDPVVKCTKSAGSKGCIVLMLDLGVDTSGGEDGCVATPPEPPANDPLSPEPERVEASEQNEDGLSSSGEAPSVPDQEFEGEPEPEPELVTGPIEGDEREVVISLFAAGKTPAEVAEQQGRKLKQLQNFKYNNSDAILQAMQAQEAPETEPAAKVVPPANVPTSLADLLTGPEREIDIHLNAVGYVDGWSPVRDLKMAEGLGRGDGASMVAEDLGLEKRAVVDRWRLINQDPVSIDHQSRLVRVLRLRAKGAVEAAE